MELSASHVVAGDSPALRFMLVWIMLRKYDYRGRYLPHLQKDDRALFITFATHHRWHLQHLALALALEACAHTHNKKCILHAAVIMPDHVHVVLTPLADQHGSLSIPQIMHTIKSESAHRINKALDRKGGVWQDESFDHVLRNDESLASKIEYVLENPVRAGLVKEAAEYRWLWREPQLCPRLHSSAGESPAPTQGHPNPFHHISHTPPGES